MRAASRSDCAPCAVLAERFGRRRTPHRTGRRARSTSASLTRVDRCDEIAHAVAVDRVAEANLGLDFVAFGHGDLAHVVAEAGDLERVAHRARRQPRGPRRPSSLCTSLVLPVADDHLRASRSRLQMKPNSRSPWADWFRFMKSMSIVDHGMSRLNCVCRCSNGFCSCASPAIHILAGENVCIHVIRPMQFGAELASWQMSWIAPAPVSTGLNTTLTGNRRRCCPSPATMACESRSTCLQHFVAVEVLAAGDEPDFKWS